MSMCFVLMECILVANNVTLESYESTVMVFLCIPYACASVPTSAHLYAMLGEVLWLGCLVVYVSITCGRACIYLPVHYSSYIMWIGIDVGED